jgi:uncharacterized membrane protein YoaK (UPF0700 family)
VTSSNIEKWEKLWNRIFTVILGFASGLVFGVVFSIIYLSNSLKVPVPAGILVYVSILL